MLRMCFVRPLGSLGYTGSLGTTISLSVGSVGSVGGSKTYMATRSPLEGKGKINQKAEEKGKAKEKGKNEKAKEKGPKGIELSNIQTGLITENPSIKTKSRRKDHTKELERISQSTELDRKLLQTQASNWGETEAWNVGIKWKGGQIFQPVHPASLFGKVLSQHELKKDKSFPTWGQSFIEDVWAKRGPSCETYNQFKDEFKKYLKSPESVKGSVPFRSFMRELYEICTGMSTPEHPTSTMIKTLIPHIGFNDGEYLVARFERKLAVVTSGTLLCVVAKPEVTIGKIVEGNDEIMYLMCSETKPVALEKRNRGEAQVVGEFITGMFYNYTHHSKVYPLINVFCNGAYLKFYLCNAPPVYVEALAENSLMTVTARPTFAVWPAHDANKPDERQGYNMLTHEGRLNAINALLAIRHNLICTCTTVHK